MHGGIAQIRQNLVMAAWGIAECRHTKLSIGLLWMAESVDIGLADQLGCRQRMSRDTNGGLSMVDNAPCSGFVEELRRPVVLPDQV